MLTLLAEIANLLAAIGVFASVAVLAYELRLTRRQAELTNWQQILQTMTEYKSRGQDPVFADLLVRGHADYANLKEAERLAFGLYLEQGLHIYGTFLEPDDSLPHQFRGMEDTIARHFYDLLRTPGGRAWWKFAQEREHFTPRTIAITNAFLNKCDVAGSPPARF